jgi:dolichol-phosphate mannosyltransferase
VRCIRLSRNFGQQVATTAGLEHARGDAVMIIDADLQDPPELIEQMHARWREGYHVIYGERSSARARRVSSCGARTRFTGS